MAVTQPKFAKDYARNRKRGALIAVITSQAFTTIALAGLLYGVGYYTAEPITASIVVGIQAIIGTLLAIVLYRSIARPLQAMLAAVIHVSGEPSDLTPPNPNTDQNEQSGFKDVLQTIYSLASNTAKPAPAPTNAEKNASTQPVIATTAVNLQTALDETICGFVVLNGQRVITYANKAAPVDVTTEGTTKLALLFNGTNTLDAWLDECEQNAVHAEKVWTRIPNKLPEEEDRRFFDVIATYDKGAENEVVLTLVDRTTEYGVNERDLDFIAFAAHELRGPITVIRGYLDVLQDELGDRIDPEHKELFRRLTVSANRLSGYINNILNTARYDRRHLKMRLIETTAAEIYDMIRDDMNLRASSQGRLLADTIPTDLPKIAADPASLSEVLGNLIDNAIKYSNEGGSIAVRAALKGDFVEIAVEDHGIGMPGNVVSNLFQKFYRSHRSRETVAGTGIGLYISKAIVESHGGTINVQSEEGKGSTFTVSIPTYQSVADKLKASDNSNEGMIDQGSGWIKNHSMYRG